MPLLFPHLNDTAYNCNLKKKQDILLALSALILLLCPITSYISDHVYLLG